MILLGIVGTPASGKSTVATYLESLGAFWINADLIARDVLNEPDVILKVTDRFGPSVMGEDGLISRSELAALVFGNSQENAASLDFLESIVHPITRERIAEKIKQAARAQFSVAILDVPLLFESKWDRCCDAIWCVDADRERRMEWAKKRGWTADELGRREGNQLSIAEKRRLSNHIVENQATLTELFQLLDHRWSDLVTMEGVVVSTPDPGHCYSD
jgi:dephospho-CoA kinase